MDFFRIMCYGANSQGIEFDARLKLHFLKKSLIKVKSKNQKYNFGKNRISKLFS